MYNLQSNTTFKIWIQLKIEQRHVSTFFIKPSSGCDPRKGFYIQLTKKYPKHDAVWFLKKVLLDCTLYTGLFEMIVGVLTTCRTQYTWDRRIYIFYLIEQHSRFVTYLTSALYAHHLWFYNHRHDNVSTQNTFSLPFAAILVNCAPSGEIHNYCTPYIIK